MAVLASDLGDGWRVPDDEVTFLASTRGKPWIVEPGMAANRQNVFICNYILVGITYRVLYRQYTKAINKY